MELTVGVYSEPEDTLLTTRALSFLAAGPADVVDLIGHVCRLPGAPRIFAEHMAHAMFAGRPQFVRNGDGRCALADLTVQPYAVRARPAPLYRRSPSDLLRGRPSDVAMTRWMRRRS